MRRFPCWRNECADDVSPYAIFSAVTSDQPHLDEVVEVTSGGTLPDSRIQPREARCEFGDLPRTEPHPIPHRERKFTLPFPRSNTSLAVCLARSNVSVFCPILF